jgi:hypothetical protein
MKKDKEKESATANVQIWDLIFGGRKNEVKNKVSEVETIQETPVIDDPESNIPVTDKVVESNDIPETVQVDDVQTEIDEPVNDDATEETEATETPETSEQSEVNDKVQTEVDELEQFFASVTLPVHPVDITPDYTICEPQRYVCGAIKAVRSGRYNTNEFLLRLSQLRLFIEGGHEINASHRETIRTRWQEKWDDRIKAVEDHLNTRKPSNTSSVG